MLYKNRFIVKLIIINLKNLTFNTYIPPIHRANPAIAKTAINTNIADIINMALPNFHVALSFIRAIDTLEHVDLGAR